MGSSGLLSSDSGAGLDSAALAAPVPELKTDRSGGETTTGGRTRSMAYQNETNYVCSMYVCTYREVRASYIHMNILNIFEYSSVYYRCTMLYLYVEYCIRLADRVEYNTCTYTFEHT